MHIPGNAVTLQHGAAGTGEAGRNRLPSSSRQFIEQYKLAFGKAAATGDRHRHRPDGAVVGQILGS